MAEPRETSTSIVNDARRRKDVRRLDRVSIRFAGAFGDGMQLTGDRFTSETAAFGSDLSTLPDMSSFELHFAVRYDILTPGDSPNVLVAMNPAALKANIGDVPRGADIIVNMDEFTKRAMAKVGYDASPLEDGSLDAYHVHPVPMNTLTAQALKDFALSRQDAGRSKTMFALGLLSWMYDRPTEGTEKFLWTKFARKPDIAEAIIAAFRAGRSFGATTFEMEDAAALASVARASETAVADALAPIMDVEASLAALKRSLPMRPESPPGS